MAILITTAQAEELAKSLAASAVDQLAVEQDAHAQMIAISAGNPTVDDAVSYGRVASALQAIAADLRA